MTTARVFAKDPIVRGLLNRPYDHLRVMRTSPHWERVRSTGSRFIYKQKAYFEGIMCYDAWVTGGTDGK